MSDDDRFFSGLREVDPAPPVPREEMWSAIQARRHADIEHHASDRVPAVDGVLQFRGTRRAVLQWTVGLAAMLAAGVGIGRMTAANGGTGAEPAVAAMDEVATSPYTAAAAVHMQRTEMLLASLKMRTPGDDTAEMSGWARDLLTDTRLLLSSPAAEDPATRRLLEDLELVLAQIAAIPTARAAEEVELIQDGMNQSDVLLRLRAATSGPRLVGT